MTNDIRKRLEERIIEEILKIDWINLGYVTSKVNRLIDVDDEIKALNVYNINTFDRITKLLDDLEDKP